MIPSVLPPESRNGLDTVMQFRPEAWDTYTSETYRDWLWTGPVNHGLEDQSRPRAARSSAVSWPGWGMFSTIWRPAASVT